MDNVNVHICVPGTGRGPFLAHCVGLAIHATQAGINVNITQSESSDLICLRQRIVLAALEAGATHLLMLDDDILAPRDVVLRFLERELPVVIANYVKKDMTYTPVAANGLGPEQLVSSVGKKGLERVLSSGLGCAFIEADVFRKITFPWFGHRWFCMEGTEEPVVGIPDLGQWKSTFEDTWLFGRIAEAGIEVYLDHDISHQIVHWGQIGYFIDGLVGA